MLGRVASLRVWLLGAMVVSAAIGLGGAALIYSALEHSREHSEDSARALNEARAIAAQAQSGADRRRLANLQALLDTDRVTVRRGGRVIFQGPARTGERFELQVQAPFRGGMVTLADYERTDTRATLDLILITGAVLLLVILAAVVTATLIARAVRVPVGRAIAAADQVSQGDLGARMGSSGPEELVKLGRAFDGMAARLERADRDQRQFLADVAHEIATPVNSVSGFALALADGTITDDAQRAEARSLIGAETARLRELLEDLRELTRLDFTEGVRVTSVSLVPFARGLAARFTPAAEDAGIELTVKARRGEAATDSRLLETIASNLLSNAIRYTPRGGHVELGVRQHRGGLLLWVRDTGIGIAPEHRERIFERLYRVDAARDRATGGSGLGLAIASRAAHSLGGHIELETTLGEGSEFRLVLPSLSAGFPADHADRHPGAPDEPTPAEPSPDEQTPDEQTPDQPTPDQPTPEERRPDERSPDEPAPTQPSTASTATATNSSARYSSE
jgi:histidine kinase